MPKRRANGEGTIFPRRDKDGKVTMWAAEYMDNAGKRRTLYGKTQQEVKNKLKAAIRQSDDGLQMDKGKLTLAKWLVEWLEVYIKPVRRKSTYAHYYHIIYTHIIPAFPNVMLKDLRLDMLQKFFNEKAISGRLDGKDGGMSVNYLEKFKQIFLGALKQAEENGIIATNIASKIKLPPRKQSETIALSRDEQMKLEKAIENSINPLSFAILLDLYTGLRIGELLALKINDIDLDKKELHVRSTRRQCQIPGTGKIEMIEGEPKTRKSKRTIPLNKKITACLKKYLEHRYAFAEIVDLSNRSNDKEDASKHLFITQNGTIPSYPAVQALFLKLLASAEVRKVNIHVLRHTFATRCMESGFDVRTLADILGHSNALMTLNVYSHSMDEQKRSSVEKLSNIFYADESGNE